METTVNICNASYRLSDPSRKPLANGLLSIFNCVTYESCLKNVIVFLVQKITYVGVLIGSHSNELCLRKGKGVFQWWTSLARRRRRLHWSTTDFDNIQTRHVFMHWIQYQGHLERSDVDELEAQWMRLTWFCGWPVGSCLLLVSFNLANEIFSFRIQWAPLFGESGCK